MQKSSPFAIFLLSVYTIIALFGMGMVLMPSEHGSMMGGGCPLMRDTGSLCEMGILDHIAHWNLLFAAIVFSVSIVVISLARVAGSERNAAVLLPDHERKRRFQKNNPFGRLFYHFQKLFSDGIIQPRVFA